MFFFKWPFLTDNNRVNDQSLFSILYEPCHEKTCPGFPTRSATNWAVAKADSQRLEILDLKK